MQMISGRSVQLGLRLAAQTILCRRRCRKLPFAKQDGLTKGDHSSREAVNFFVLFRKAPVEPAHARYPGSTHCCYRAASGEIHLRPSNIGTPREINKVKRKVLIKRFRKPSTAGSSLGPSIPQLSL